MKWIGEYEQAIIDAGIPAYAESARLRGCSFPGRPDSEGYYPYHDLLSDVDKIRRGEMTQEKVPAKIQKQDRFAFVRKYGFAIPCREALDAIARAFGDDGVLEVGAGTGYWLCESLKLHPHCGWRATDLRPPTEGKRNNAFRFERPFVAVEPLGAVEAVEKYPRSTLLMIWPSYDEPWAADALEAYRREKLIYVGEGSGGCCADDRFWEMIESGWEEDESRGVRIPCWWGIHDRLSVYQRKR